MNQTDQGLQLDQRRKSLAHLITCHLWAPYIFENEIEFTGWDTTWNTAYGYWAGKPVGTSSLCCLADVLTRYSEIYYGYDDVTMKSLDRRMHAARTLRDLDLTQEVHGHLLNDDSEVIGLVVEPASGRLLRLEDRAQVYQAVAKLQRHYCILPNVRDGAILISEGKVRFPFVSEIRYYPPDQRSEFRESAERDHWQALDGVFAELEEGLTPQPITLFSAPLPVLFIPSYPLERPFPVVAMYINSRIMDSSYGTDDTEYNSVERPVLLGTQADVSFAIEQTGRALGARITLFRRSDIQRNRQALPSPTPAPGSLRVQRHVSQRRSRLDAAQLRLHNALNRRRRAKETGSDSYSDVTSESGSASSRIEEIF